jgi:hypothetical protein
MPVFLFMCRYYSETFASGKDFEGRNSKWNLVPGYKRPGAELRNFLEQSREVNFEETIRHGFSFSPKAFLRSLRGVLLDLWSFQQSE